MFEGNRFFPLTNTPIWKIALSKTMLAVWEPDPLTVATWIEKSLMRVFAPWAWGEATGVAFMGFLSWVWDRGEKDDNEGVNN